jgi:glycosyltransferase involved in cell wall biosynthesis
MKVCHIVSSFPRKEGDPNVPWLLEIVRRLKEKGVDITIFAPSFKGLASHEISGIPVKRFRYFLKNWEDLTHNEGMPTKIRNPFYWIVFIFYFLFGLVSFIRFCKKENFDVIHVHWPFPHTLIGYAGSKVCKAKLISTFYTVEVLLIKNRFKFLKPILKFVIKKSDDITCISSFIAEEVKRMVKCDEKVHLVPTPAAIREEKFVKKRRKTKRILFVGRIIERKGIKYLIRAMPFILKEIKASLIIIGFGNKKEGGNLRRITNQLGLNKEVIFLGSVSSSKLKKEYQNCDTFVLPAIIDSKGDTEGLGVVIIEALTYKKPVVASNVGGIPDLIKNEKTGLLVSEKSPEELARAIIRVLKDKRLANNLGTAGYKNIKKNFSYGVIIKQLMRLYEKVDKN